MDNYLIRLLSILVFEICQSQQSFRMNFGGIAEEEFSTVPTARVSWSGRYRMRGQSRTAPAPAQGAMAIVDASRNMELYEEETGAEVYKIGIHTLDEIHAARPRPTR